MIISMVRSLAPALLAGFLLSVPAARAQAPNPDLSSVQTVYVLAMGNGVDQFIAHQVARHGVYQVTTDPLQADAFLSDYVGTTFELRVTDLLKTAREKLEKEAEELAKKEAAKAPKPKESAKDSKDKDKKEDKEEASSGEFQMAGSAARVQSFSRGRGNIFLVDAKSRRVLWTGFDVPKNTRPGELQKSAERLVGRLLKDKTGK